MRYISTRGLAQPQSFESMLLSGLAPDGGLFLPEVWPQFGKPEIARLATGRYVDAAFAILPSFVGDAFARDEIRADIESAYAAFDSAEVASLVRLRENLFLLELFHGPTLAFKDIALQVQGRLLARALERRGSFSTIVAATSGDTGSAAIAALGDLPRVNLFVLHPKGHVSEIQRRQMTTTACNNVYNIALEGTFDDAQNIVKSLFSDREFVARVHLAAANSINFFRIAAQCVYYFTAAARFGSPPVFVVPTGNFGDVFAGEAAMRMGLGIERLVIATNANDILCRALEDGLYAAGPPRHTLSPSMDIQVASNFERAYFEASGRDPASTRATMSDFETRRRFHLPADVLANLRARYLALRCSDEETLETMDLIYRETGRFIDPHTAVGVAVALARGNSRERPMIVLSTAHPAKFPDAVYRATGIVPPLPRRVADLYEKAERASTLPADVSTVRTFIEQRLANS
ncbi:MAG TPA: threonine synthase [Rhizomicrobium sp.]